MANTIARMAGMFVMLICGTKSFIAMTFWSGFQSCPDAGQAFSNEKSARNAGHEFLANPQFQSRSALMRGIGGQFSSQPGPGVGPVSLGCPWRDPLQSRRLFDRHAGKYPQLDQFGGWRINGREARQRVVEVQQLVADRRRDAISVRQFATRPTAATTVAKLLPCQVDQDSPH